MRQKLLISAAVFFGILAFLLTYSQIQSEKARIRGASEVVMLIELSRAVAGGEPISTKDIKPRKERRLRSSLNSFREIPWSRHQLIIGRKLVTSMEKGNVLQWDDLEPASSKLSGLTGIVPPGYRAVSIAVDRTSSVTNLVKPGDHVDVIGTFRFPEMRGDRSLDTITMTILQNVTILATGGNWGRASQGPATRTSSSYSTVTLALTPKEVEMVIFASQKGKLTLSLRNYEETKFENQLQSVNFKYLQNNILKYNLERQRRQRNR